MQVKLHQGQLQVAQDTHRFKVICAGRRWGKSVLAQCIVLKWAVTNVGSYWIVSPTYRQGKEIHWLALKNLIPLEWVAKINEAELSVVLKNGSIIALKGAENPDSLRGSKLRGLVIDEIASIRNWDWLYKEVLRATLLDYTAPALFISTPKGYNHFYELYIDGQGRRLDYKSWKFSTYENEFVQRSEIESIKEKENPDVFAQEYLADFTHFTGLIYKEFDTSSVEYFAHEKNQHGEYIAGLDFAVRGWTASLMSYIDENGHIWHLDEYKVEALTAKDHATAIKEKLQLYADRDKWTIYADPAGWMRNQQRAVQGNKPLAEMIYSIADEYIEEGLPITRANNEVTAGINYVRQLHKSKMIHVHPRCVEYVEEKIRYQWLEQTPQQLAVRAEPEKPRKTNDHLMDCERYECFSKPLAAEALEVKQPFVFPATFPIINLDVPDENADQYEEIEIPSLYDV